MAAGSLYVCDFRNAVLEHLAGQLAGSHAPLTDQQRPDGTPFLFPDNGCLYVKGNPGQFILRHLHIIILFKKVAGGPGGQKGLLIFILNVLADMIAGGSGVLHPENSGTHVEHQALIEQLIPGKVNIQHRINGVNNQFYKFPQISVICPGIIPSLQVGKVLELFGGQEHQGQEHHIIL